MSEILAQIMSTLSDYLYSYILVGLLVATGLYITVRLRFVQLRRLGAIFSSIKGSTKAESGAISSFQAFSVGVGTRIGIGNIGGVAIALVLGGPGAIFWMWVVAIIGMATAFAESTLAQIFKVRHEGDNTFRGGPSYYIKRGLKCKPVAYIYAFITVFSAGVVVPMVQVNTVAATLESNHSVPTWVTGVIIVLLIAPVIVGGIRSVARISAVLAPLMAGAYLLIAAVVIVTNLGAVANAFAQIFQGAFGLEAGLGGVAGGLFATILNGARRGLFSNEAGMGTAPNAAATATVAHPVQQGFLQSFGVFVDTIIVCTITALLILVAGSAVFEAGVTPPEQAGALTAQAVIHLLGDYMALPMSLIIFVFGYTSSFGAYSYGQVAFDLFTNNKIASLCYKIFVVVACGVAAVQPLTLVWSLADVLLGLGTIVNLVVLVLLLKWVTGALRDYEQQEKAGLEPKFVAKNNPNLPADIDGDIWV